MTITLTSEEFQKRISEHSNETEYNIFHFVDEMKVEDTTFWVKSKDEARSMYDEFVKTHGSDIDYYFGQRWNFTTFNKETNTYKLSDNFMDSFCKNSDDDPEDDEDQSDHDRIVDNTQKYFKKDMNFFIKHYDVTSRTSHMMSESWSLDCHMLSDLEFNIPIIMRHIGVPQKFVDIAEKELGDGTPPGEVSEYGKKLWNDRMLELLHHVWLYQFYNDYGIIDDTYSKEKREFLESHKNDIAYERGMYKEIDYKAMDDLLKNEWINIWMWIIEDGRSLWT